MFFIHTLKNLRLYLHSASCNSNDANTLKNTRFCNAEYYPFYALNYKPDSNLPYQALLDNNFELDEYEKTYGGGEWKKNELYIKFLRTCLERKAYNLLLSADNHLLRACTTTLGLSNSFTSRLSLYLISPYVGNISSYPANIGGTFPDAFEHIRLSNVWSSYTARRTKKEEERKSYICNMFFMAEVEGSLYNLETASIKPLFSLMVKKENMALIRAYFSSNLPIPVSMLELWVDQSTEAEGSRIKPYFRKFIKSKLEAASVPIKYFPDLKKEMFLEFKTPIFETQEEHDNWTVDILNSFYDIQLGKAKYDSVVPKQVSLEDERIKPITIMFEKELAEVIAAIS